MSNVVTLHTARERFARRFGAVAAISGLDPEELKTRLRSIGIGVSRARGGVLIMYPMRPTCAFDADAQCTPPCGYCSD